MNALLAPSPREHTTACDHFVHFYERDEVLCNEVAAFLGNGMRSGAAAILIAKPAHSQLVLEACRRAGYDHSEAVKRGQLIVLDAAQTLARFMVDGRPDATRFDEVVGRLVRSTLANFDELVAFGEMVSLLWADNRPAAAIELEQMWNALVSKHRFALYCAYSMAECGHAELSEQFQQVCAQHAYVMPAEGMATARTEAEQVRWIAQLQQKAAALEGELARRKEAERRLAERERELADFVENAALGLHRVGPDGTILWANRAELAMLGYTEEEYFGRNIAEFHLDQGGIERILRILSSGGTLHDQPARLRCKDGSIRHVLITSNARIENGGFIGTRCFTRDVTERWLAQEALRERGAVLHLAMQGARMGYWISDLSNDDIRCSPELSELLGRDKLMERPLPSFSELMHPEDRTTFQQALQCAIDARGMLQCEFRMRKEDEWRWFEARGEAVFGPEGQPVRFYGVCSDVTARRREQTLLQHLAAVVDSADDAIVSKSLDGIVSSWNGAATRIFGYPAEEMIGQSILKLIPPELRAEEDTIIAKMRAGERVEHFVTTRLARDGTRKQVSISVSPVRDRAGRIIGASKIAREVTNLNS